jgi:hypothetical protein
VQINAPAEEGLRLLISEGTVQETRPGAGAFQSLKEGGEVLVNQRNDTEQVEQCMNTEPISRKVHRMRG